MPLAPLHQGLDQSSVVCEQHQSFRILIQSPRISNTDRKFHHVRDLFVGKSVLFRTGYPHRLIICQHHLFILSVKRFSVYSYLVILLHLHPCLGCFPVHHHSSLFNQSVCLPSGAQTAGGKIFI